MFLQLCSISRSSIPSGHYYINMMIKELITGACLIIVTNAFSQVDSAAVNNSNFYNSLRLGLGVEKNPFFEIGFSRLVVVDKGLNSGSICFYGSGQFNAILTESESKYLYGGKIGFETAWMVGMWGAEVKCLTTGINSQWFFTPRIGLSLLGTTSILYGINLPTKDNKLNEIGRHQISLTVNLSKRLMKDIK